MAETVFSWVSAIPAWREAHVRQFLQSIGNHFGTGSPLPLGALKTLHFASLTLCPRPETCGDPLLIFECSIDEPFKAFVKELDNTCWKGLDQIYEGCEGYPRIVETEGSPNQSAERIAYLSSSAIRKGPRLFHLGHPERSVATIRADCELRRSVEEEFRTNDRLKEMSPANAQRELRRIAKCPSGWSNHRRYPEWCPKTASDTDPDPPPAPLNTVEWKKESRPWARIWRAVELLFLAWALGVALVLFAERWVFVEAIVAVEFVAVYLVVHYTSSGARMARGLIVALPLALVVFFSVQYLPPLVPRWFRLAFMTAVLAPGVFLFLAYIRIRFVLRPTAPPPHLSPEAAAVLLDAEDRPAHSIYNHVLGLSEIRPDWKMVRLARTWLVLWLLNLFYRVQFVKGQLVSVPTIHFAHWTLMHGRYLLFNVHYDGGADRYLDDFFNSLAQGVGFIWFDTTLYPRVSDPRRLKAWVRQSQTLPLVRYRAAVYHDLTVADINNNRLIRRGLLHGRARWAERWLARFTTALPDDPWFFDTVDRWIRRFAPIK